MSTRSAVIVLLVLAAVTLPAAGYVHRPVSVCFFPPLSTNGPEADNVSSNLSFNIIGGVLGELNGVELASVFNIEAGSALGYQAAGALNVVAGDFTGLQQAGAVCVAGKDVRVLQQAGAAAVAGGGVDGVQMAGGACVAGTRLTGAQFAGGANVLGGSGTGLQAAGGANITGSSLLGAQLAGGANICGGLLTGLQLSGGFNFADRFTGAQIGVVNAAGQGTGLQLGVVNISEDVDVPIGIVSIVENGRFSAGIWASDAAPVNVGVKTGSDIIYNVFALGLRPDGDSTRLLAGLGIGGQVPLGQFFVDIDAVGYACRMASDWFEDPDSDLLSRLRITGGWHVNDWLAVTAGPALSVWVSDDEDGSALPLYDAPLYEYAGRTFVRIWPGFTAGIEIF